MSSGKTHDRFNLFVGIFLAGILLGIFADWLLSLFVLSGWLFSTLFFSPDTDCSPRKRSGVLQFFLYPYSIIFKHRGISHNIILGTLTRVIYGILLFALLVFVFHKMGYIRLSLHNFGEFILHFLKNFDYNIPIYRYFVWFYLGMFLSDLCHILLDKISSFVKKWWRKVF